MNPCETAAVLLADDWQHQLEAPERAGDRLFLRQHLHECAECAAMAGLWQRLGELPEALPSPHQRERFDQMLEAYNAGQAAQRAAAPAPRRVSFFPAWAFHPMPAMAAALLLVAGLAGGWFLRGRSAPAPSSQDQQIAELRDQVTATRQLAVLSLLQQQSASDRLQGVSYGARLSESDPKISDALLHTLKYDASADVRLSALDALQRGALHAPRDSDLQKNLVEAFRYQQSPLVQIALVDSFVELHDQSARALLQRVSTDTAYSPEVRQRAAWGLAQPTWN
ncbi:MAG TPA: HEAT repeat domain-containing protein [Terriglobales bacterium]|nr:HEAT repeat domain-containing protein [Terriglobales bacterium]